MFDELEDGFETALIGVLVGLVVSAVLAAFSSQYSILFDLLGLVGSIAMITKFKYWASGYLIGYLSAEWVLSAIGLENPALVIIYTLFAGLLIFVRFTERVSDFLDDLWQ
jgi:hypothetical protein